MNPIRMTVEELKELLDANKGPVELKCDDGYFVDMMKSIKVIGLDKGHFAHYNSAGNLELSKIHYLNNYPSKKSAPSVTRYWIWSTYSTSENCWLKARKYYTDEGLNSGGEKSINEKEFKHENEWIELDEKGELVNWAGKV